VNLHSAPDIFIIDEALAVGDTLFQFKCFAHLEQFRARGGTLLLVTHDETAVRSLCDRAIWLDHGRMIADGKADHVCSLYYATSAVASGAGGIGGAGGDARARARPPRSVRPDSLQPDSALPDGPLPAPLPPQRPAPDSAKPRFDPDRLGARTAPGAIAELQARSEGATDAVLEGGADTTICFTYRGPQEPGLEAGILFRDRMALTIFACFQPLTFTSPESGPQQVRFRFDLPFVPTGDYVIEALVLKTGGNAPQLIDKSAPCPVSLRTRHISEGLANLRMNAVSLRALPEPAAAR
jgi:lipopolysaccharide transport system ATP-binding protein